MSNKDLQRNIKVYYAYLGVFQLLIGPILTLYLLNKNLSFTQIMALQSVFSVSVFLLEVPTGAVGDLMGRKVSLCLAGLVMALGAAVYIFADYFLLFIFGEMLFACGLSLKSGSDTAILYDTLKVLDRTDEFTKIQGKGQFFFLFTQVIGSLVAGFIYEINVDFPLVLSGVLMLLSALLALLFKEVPTFATGNKPSYSVQIKESGQFLLNHKRIRAITLYSMFFFVFYRLGFWYYQPYLTAVNVEVKYFGIAFALFNLVAAFSAKYSDRFIKLTKGKSMLLLSALMAASFLLCGLTPFAWGLIFILPQQIARGINQPIFMKYMNKHIPSHMRATVISFNSLLKNLAAAIAFPIAGFFMDRIDIMNIHVYSGLLMVIGIISFSSYLNSNMKTQETFNTL